MGRFPDAATEPWELIHVALLVILPAPEIPAAAFQHPGTPPLQAFPPLPIVAKRHEAGVVAAVDRKVLMIAGQAGSREQDTRLPDLGDEASSIREEEEVGVEKRDRRLLGKASKHGAQEEWLACEEILERI